MSYFGVLLFFLVPPLIVLLVYVPRAEWLWLYSRFGRSRWTIKYTSDSPDPKPYMILLLHVLLALLYTTPWDNYLVATSVWWYDPNLVTGLTLGYVPIEEYTFFILQTLVSGLWVILLLQEIIAVPKNFQPNNKLRLASSSVILLAVLISVILYSLNWQAARYILLIIMWAGFPLFFQAIFGADILKASWRVIFVGTLIPTLYLWWVDWLAIESGTWTINPDQTTGLLLNGLPVEEMLFFLLTNLMITCGITLMLSPYSLTRVKSIQDVYSKFSHQSFLVLFTRFFSIKIDPLSNQPRERKPVRTVIKRGQ
jgi:lycopene cyclase domain-containing protein